MDNYTGQKVLFHVESGPKNEARNVTDILEFFELFFDRQIIQHIVIETNRYAEQYKIQRGNLFTFQSPVHSWVPVTENEIYVVFGVVTSNGNCAKVHYEVLFFKEKSIIDSGLCRCNRQGEV
jgi:hypothetical protein